MTPGRSDASPLRPNPSQPGKDQQTPERANPGVIRKGQPSTGGWGGADGVEPERWDVKDEDVSCSGHQAGGGGVGNAWKVAGSGSFRVSRSRSDESGHISRLRFQRLEPKQRLREAPELHPAARRGLEAGCRFKQPGLLSACCLRSELLPPVKSPSPSRDAALGVPPTFFHASP